MIEAWREIPIPARKTQYEGKHILLLDNPERGEIPRDAWPHGYSGNPDITDTVVLLTRRMNAKDTWGTSTDVSRWGTIRVMRVRWYCSHCASGHECYVPESWLAEGKAVFVEKVTTAEDEHD